MITHDRAGRLKNQQFHWPSWVLNNGISVKEYTQMEKFILCSKEDFKRAIKDLRNEKFGRLAPIKVIGKTTGKNILPVWDCLCDCGEHTLVPSSRLREKKTRSCGCLAKENKSNLTHGMSGTPTHRIWKSMLLRTRSNYPTSFKNYKGRGIDVCDRWLKFENFYKDMGPRPKGKEIDRRDNNKGYYPDNCRWVSRTINSRNKRSNKIISFNGKSQCLSEWAEEIGMNPTILGKRFLRGWSPEEALTIPLLSNGETLPRIENTDRGADGCFKKSKIPGHGVN